MEWRNERESRAREQSEGANAVRTKHFQLLYYVWDILLSCDRDVKLCQKGLLHCKEECNSNTGSGGRVCAVCTVNVQNTMLMQ